MADFNKAFDYMIINEDFTVSGVITMDNNGALVRFGLNAASNPQLVPLGFYDQNPDGTPKMIREHALIVAKNLYNTSSKYWRKIAGDSIVSQPLASKMFDCQVNTEDAPKLLQHYLRTLDHTIGVDGIVGVRTLSFVNSLDPLKVLAGFNLWWNWFIDQVLKNNPDDKKYEKAWRTRANKVPPMA